MKVLTNAIVKKFKSDAVLAAAFPGGIFAGRAPEGTTTQPYLVYTVIAAAASSRFGGVGFVEVSIRFTAWGIGADAVTAVADTLAAEFDEATLPLSTGTLMNSTRMTDPVPQFAEVVDGESQEWWRADVEYTFAAQ